MFFQYLCMYSVVGCTPCGLGSLWKEFNTLEEAQQFFDECAVFFHAPAGDPSQLEQVELSGPGEWDVIKEWHMTEAQWWAMDPDGSWTAWASSVND